MKTPEARWHNNALICFGRIEADQKFMAERKWREGLKPTAPQLPAAHGLFGDEHLQLDLVEMLQN
jgi:hypothetical protein